MRGEGGPKNEDVEGRGEQKGRHGGWFNKGTRRIEERMTNASKT